MKKFIFFLFLISISLVPNILAQENSSDIQGDENSINALQNEINSLYSQGKINESLSITNNLLENDPANFEWLFYKMRALNALGKFDESIKTFDGINGTIVTNKLLYQKGIALANNGNVTEAIKYFGYLDEADSLRIPSLINSIRLFYDTEKYVEAIEISDKVLKIDPHNIDALNFKSASLIKIGKFNESLEYFDLILSIDPNNIDAKRNKAYALISLKQYDIARKILLKILDDNKDDINTTQFLGISYAREGKLDIAISLFHEVISKDPLNIFGYKNLGMALLEQKKHDEAITNFNIALNLDPNDEFSSKNKNIALSEKNTGTIDTIIIITVLSFLIASVSLFIQIIERRSGIFIKDKILDIWYSIKGVYQVKSNSKNPRTSQSTKKQILLFILGIVTSISVVIGLWYGSNYASNQTPLEVGIRVSAVYNFPYFYSIILVLFAISGTSSVFYRNHTVSPAIAGLAVSMALIELYLVLSDVHNFPFYDNIGK